MSFPEAPASMQATTGEPPSTLEPEGTGQLGPVRTPAQELELVTAELRMVRILLDETNLKLLHSRISYQSEAQSRQTLQRGLDALQQTYVQLVTNYKSIYKEDQQKIASLQEDHRLAEELMGSQRQLLNIYEGQQQPASHLVQGGPLLSQSNQHNHSCQYTSYQPPRSHEFVIDPTALRPLNDLDYSIGSSIEPSCDADPVMPTPAEQTSNLSIQSILQPTSAERDTPGPTYTKSDEKKMGPGEEGTKPNKKRKMNVR